MRKLILFLFLPVLAFGQVSGYSVPATGTGLSVCIGPGTNNMSGVPVTYSGSCLAMTQNATNFGYLDATSGILSVNTTGAPFNACPVFEADTDYFQVNKVRDVRVQICAGAGGSGNGALLGTANTWTGSNTWNGASTFGSDIRFTPVGGPSLFVNRSISTSTGTPSNGGSWILGPGDPVVNGCANCTPALSVLNLTSNNGIPVMVMFKPSGSNAPAQVGDYIGVKLGYSTLAGAQQFGSGIAGNSDLLGELSFTAATTATYTWINAPGTIGQYTIHPECHVTPQFDYSTNRYWITYSTNVSFTVNFSSAVTGSVSYLCGFRN